MRVRAKELGYYGHKRRHPGQEFDLEPIKRIRKDKDGNPREVTISPEQQFSNKWMEKVDSGTPPVARPVSKKRITEPVGEAATDDI